MSRFKYNATVKRIVGPRTIEIEADLGFFVKKRLHVLLNGVAPEPDGPRAARAIIELGAMLAGCDGYNERTGEVECQVESFKGRSFDRWRASVTVTSDGGNLVTSLSSWLVANGLANPEGSQGV